MDTQDCPRCGRTLLPLSAFTPSYRGRQGKPCKTCNDAATRPYKNAERRALRQLRDRHPDEYRQLYRAALDAGA